MPNTGTGRSEMDKETLSRAERTLRVAAEELAHERGKLQFRQLTTAADAKFVTDKASVDAWITVQLADMTLPTLLCDVLTAHLTDDELRRYERNLLGHPMVIDAYHRKALELAVATYLADEADKILADGPTDDEVYRPYTPVDHDRRALARSQNAAVRLEQML